MSFLRNTKYYQILEICTEIAQNHRIRPKKLKTRKYAKYNFLYKHILVLTSNFFFLPTDKTMQMHTTVWRTYITMEIVTRVLLFFFIFEQIA